MAGTKTMTEEDEWTKANLQKLLTGLKTSIPEDGRMTTYKQGLKSVDWKQVAFPPFSPEACQEKFSKILLKMRKLRSLPELIVEAEDTLSDPDQNLLMHLGPLKKPSLPSVIFYEENCAEFQKKHPDKSQQEVFKCLTKKYQKLPDEEKDQYVQKFKLTAEEYARRKQEIYSSSECKTRTRTKTKRKRKRPSADAIDQDEQRSEDEEGMPPKPPISGFNIFCQEMPVPAFVSSQCWRELTEKQRVKYTTRYKELRREYLVKLEKYLKTVSKEKRQQILSKKDMRRYQVIKGNKTKREPKMPTRSGHQQYVKKQMALLKEKYPDTKERLGEASHKWYSLTEKEKKHYREEARKDISKYWIKLQKWLKALPAEEQESYWKDNPSKKRLFDNEVFEIPTSSAAVDRPSDSEDEVIEDSSGDEEDTQSDFSEVEGKEEEEEEDSDATMFELY